MGELSSDETFDDADVVESDDEDDEGGGPENLYHCQAKQSGARSLFLQLL